MTVTWSDVGPVLVGIAAGAAIVAPVITFARRPRLKLTADRDRTWTRIEGDGAVYVRGLVHCSRLTRGARGARVMVEGYRPKGAPLSKAVTLGGTPSLGWPSAQDGTDGSLTVHPGATRAVDVGALEQGASRVGLYFAVAGFDAPPAPPEPWYLQLTLAAGLRLTDERDRLPPSAWTIRLLVVADDARARAYDVDVSWEGDASNAQAALDSLSVSVAKG